MDLRRIWVLFRARNREFFRDRAAFGWNFLFPFLIVAGFAIMFGGRQHTEYKVGVFPVAAINLSSEQLTSLPESFVSTRYLQFVGIENAADAFTKLRHHKVDFLLQIDSNPLRYWLNDSSPKGYLVERLFMSALVPPAALDRADRQEIQGREVRYVEWLFPGILAMNMMFSALWGVGYVVVRYRKNGVLKRLQATPLTAFEYLSAQMLSRIFLLMFTLAVVWIGCDLTFSFHVEGSYFDLALVFFLGSLSLTALGLVLAARGTSEEFATGVLNFIAWPMMFLSEVWFSLEGAPQWVKGVSQLFPLTQMLRAVRQIMNEGAGLADIWPEMGVLVLMAALFLSVGAAMFSWNR